MIDASSSTGSSRTILTVNEVIRERMIASSKAHAQFKSAICPIYGSTPNGQPEQLGSCVLLEIAGKPCLMTAAHLIDSNSDTSLYIGSKDLTPIEAEFSVSPATGGNRKNDRCDFAIAELTSAFVAKLGGVRFIRDDEISGSVVPTTGHLTIVVGLDIRTGFRRQPRKGRWLPSFPSRQMPAIARNGPVCCVGTPNSSFCIILQYSAQRMCCS